MNEVFFSFLKVFSFHSKAVQATEVVKKEVYQQNRTLSLPLKLTCFFLSLYLSLCFFLSLSLPLSQVPSLLPSSLLFQLGAVSLLSVV